MRITPEHGRPETNGSEDPGPLEPEPNLIATEAALDLCLAGDQGSCDRFLAMLSRFRKGVVRMLHFRLGAKWQDAEDAFAEVLLAYCRRARSSALQKPIRDWWSELYLKARRHYWKDRKRAKKATPLVLDEADDEHFLESQAITVTTPFDRSAILDEFEQVVERLSKRLTIRQRQVLIARSEGLTHREIGQIMGCGEGSSRVMHFKAMRKARKAA